MLSKSSDLYTVFPVANLVEYSKLKAAVLEKYGMAGSLTSDKGGLVLVVPGLSALNSEKPKLAYTRVPKDYTDFPCDIIATMYADMLACTTSELLPTLKYLFMQELNNLTVAGFRVVSITLKTGLKKFYRHIFDYSVDKETFKASGKASKIDYDEISWENVVELTL